MHQGRLCYCMYLTLTSLHELLLTILILCHHFGLQHRTLFVLVDGAREGDAGALAAAQRAAAVARRRRPAQHVQVLCREININEC